MIVELNVKYDDINQDGGRDRDRVFRAVDGVIPGATWERNGDGFIARV